MDKRILVVDDEINIVEIISYNLEKEGYTVLKAYDGEEGLKMAKEENPNLVLLDIMMPKMDGFQVCREIRTFSQVPIIMLTARAEEVDKVLGLEFGADDYVTKPFGVRELMARVKANLRRSVEPHITETTKLDFGRLVIDFGKVDVIKDGEALELTPNEFELIKYLASEEGRVFSREKLLEEVWGYEFFGDVRTVDVTVRRLRMKVEDDSSNPSYIKTKVGAGYFFNNPETEM